MSKPRNPQTTPSLTCALRISCVVTSAGAQYTAKQATLLFFSWDLIPKKNPQVHFLIEIVK